jgi:hypothetical protein
MKSKYNLDKIPIGKTQIRKGFTANQLKCAIQNRKRKYDEDYSYRACKDGFKITRTK